MIVSHIYRHTGTHLTSSVSTKKIRLDANTEIYFQISSDSSSVVSLIESALVDLCGNGKPTTESDEVFFSRVLEALNRFLLAKDAVLARANLKVFLSLLRGELLSFSVCGDYQAYLQQGERITNISDGMGSSAREFSYVSSGTVGVGDALYIANKDLLGFLTKEDLAEFARTNDPQIVEDLLSREAAGDSVECLVFQNSVERDYSDVSISSRFNRPESFVTTALGAIGKAYDWAKDFVLGLRLDEKYHAFMQHEKVRAALANKRVRAGLFGTGIVVALGLLYLITSSIFHSNMGTVVPEEYKNKLIEAEQILNRSSRDLANKEAFKDNIQKAEALIFEVRDQKLFSNDVKNLLSQISVLKKQLNGIETYTLDSHPETFHFAEENYEPIELFENSKKLYVVGKNALYGPYVQGSDPKKEAYPDGEEAVSADISQEGVIYVLTKTNRVIRYNKGEFSYVNVEGQNTWEPSSKIRSFIGNLYLLSADGTQIYKHRPSVNGFTGKSPMIDGGMKGKTIFDFALDGGFYMLDNDLTFEKVFTTPGFSKKGLMLNKLPDNYSTGEDAITPKITTSSSANYLYMILANKIWIFEPDSKNVKDVRGLKYIGQIEIGERKIHSVVASKDGEMLVLTDTGISTVKFEVSDGKINIH